MSRVRNLDANWRKVLAKTLTRNRGDMSLRAYARFLGLPYPTLQRIEKGLGVDMDSLVKIQEATGQSFDELLIYGACDHQWVEIEGAEFVKCSLCPMVGLPEK